MHYGHRLACSGCRGFAASHAIRAPLHGLTGQYFSDTSFSTLALTRRDATLDVGWGVDAPDPALPADDFSVRWTGTLTPWVTDRHGLSLIANGSVKLWLDGQLLIDDADANDRPISAVGVDLELGRHYDIIIEYVHHTGDAFLRFTWAGATFGHYTVPTRQMQPTTITSTRTISYTYDGLQRLIGAEENPGSTQTYAYDLAGNRTGVWQNGTQTQNLSYNAANQVDGWSYDAAGNLLTDGTQSYTYDALNRVLSVGSTNNIYNGDGVLVQQGSTRYTHDLAAPLSQILSDGTHQYIYGNPAERLYGTANGTRTWYSVDALNSVRALLDDAGFPLGSASYDAWGVPETPLIAPFGFTGEVQQGNDVWLRARWYGAGRGAFASRDPYAGDAQMPYSMMPYQYAYSAPTVWTDASGRWACVDIECDNKPREIENQRNCRRVERAAECRRYVSLFLAYGLRIENMKHWDTRELLNALLGLSMFTAKASWSMQTFKRIMTKRGIKPTVLLRRNVFQGGSAYTEPNGESITYEAASIGWRMELQGKETFIHELAHVWDIHSGLTLSRGLQRETGSCSIVGTYYPKGVHGPYRGIFTAAEDWATAVTATVFKNYPLSQERMDEVYFAFFLYRNY